MFQLMLCGAPGVRGATVPALAEMEHKTRREIALNQNMVDLGSVTHLSLKLGNLTAFFLSMWF